MSLYWEDIVVGQVWRSGAFTFELDEILDFARRFGDSLDALDAVPALVASTEDAE